MITKFATHFTLFSYLLMKCDKNLNKYLIFCKKANIIKVNLHSVLSMKPIVIRFFKAPKSF